MMRAVLRFLLAFICISPITRPELAFSQSNQFFNSQVAVQQLRFSIGGYSHEALKPITSITRSTVTEAGQTGLATWYGHSRSLTAAHRTLPKGSCLLVENLRNGRHVNVRINDRGPNAPAASGRVIDLSYRAAGVLRMIRCGVVPVRISTINCS